VRWLFLSHVWPLLKQLSLTNNEGTNVFEVMKKSKNRKDNRICKS